MKQKVHSGINVIGLTVGITFALIIGVFCWGEWQVNRQLNDVDRLYIIERDTKDASGMAFFAPMPLGKIMVQNYPSIVENYFRFYDRNVTLSANNKHFMIQGMVGDSTFLTMFGFPLLYGNSKTALKGPHAIVITESTAKQFFNKSDAVGESLLLKSGTSDAKEFTVTAVLKDFQRNSVTDLVNINAKFIISLQNVQDFLLPNPDDWQSGEMITYLKLAPNKITRDVERTMATLVEKYGTENQKRNKHLTLKALEDYYLITQNGSAQKMILLLSGIAGFILLLAVINFINISIASATVRLKEIGVRKVVGALRKQIIFQFLVESLLVTVFAGLLAVCCYEGLRPIFESMLSIVLLPVWKLSITFWKGFIVALVSVGVCAGAYPAFFMSSYRVIELLSGKVKSSKGTLLFSKGLMTTQFVVAIFIFCCSIAVARQVSFFLTKDLGYDKSFVLTVSSVPRIWSTEGIRRMHTAKQEFLTVPGVEGASLSWDIPNGNNGNDVALYTYGGAEDRAVSIPMLKADEDFAHVYGVKVLEGKFFHLPEESWKPNTLVINNKAAVLLGLKVNDRVKMRGVDLVFTVVGIVNDFNFFSLRDRIKPVVIVHTNELQVYRFFSFKLKPGSLAQSVSAVEKKWKQVFPNDPFEYSFMDDHLTKLYKVEQRLEKASILATAIMVVIVLIGVLGLVALHVTQRTKEIGVRKVLGASMFNILGLFAKDYIGMFTIAILIAIPLAIVTMLHWLSGFAYRIELTWWMFVAPGVCLLLTALAVVFMQSSKALNADPVKSLKAG